MTLKEFQAKGGKTRWRGKSAKERSDEMRRVANIRHHGLVRVNADGSPTHTPSTGQPKNPNWSKSK